MAKDFEKDLEEGNKIQDLVRSEGWQILEQKIRQAIKDENGMIRNFPIEERALQEIAAEYLDHRANLNAYEKVFDFIQDFLTAKKEAENKLRE